jgi:hypothetical protein
MTYVLIVLIYSAGFASSSAMTVTNLPGFKSEADCQAAAQQMRAAFDGTGRAVQATCVKQ